MLDAACVGGRDSGNGTTRRELTHGLLRYLKLQLSSWGQFICVGTHERWCELGADVAFSRSIPVVSAPLIPLHHGSAETCECEAVGALRDASRGLDSDIEMENGTGELRAVEGGARVGGSSVRDGLPPSVTADLARGGSEVDTTQTGGQNEAR